MKRGLRRRPFEVLSLVPLADMLANTVGIMLFVLIFAVLASSGALVLKRFPIKQHTEMKPIMYFCGNNRIISRQLSSISDEFYSNMVEPLGKPRSYHDMEQWLRRYNTLRMEREDFVVEAEGRIIDQVSARKIELTIFLSPKEGAGETASDLWTKDNRVAQSLASHNPMKCFVYFIVRADSLEVFEAARGLAGANSFEVGWMPLAVNQRVAVSLSGEGGIVPVPQ